MNDDNDLELTKDDSVQLVQTEKKDGDTNDDKIETPIHSMTHAKAFQFFEKTLQYVQEKMRLILLKK